MANEAAAGGVQSVERAIQMLELLADAGGPQSLTQLSSASGLPGPTVHRLMSTLIGLGYVRRERSRLYGLGPRLIRLGELAGRSLANAAQASLRTLVERTGESANLAMLDGDSVLYLGQAQSPHAMRMFTEPGRRVLPHCTGVGKALLAELSADEVRGLLRRTGMPARTSATITSVDALLAQLADIRERGYAIDDGEQEVGVRCVAVPVPGPAGLVAVSISGPSARIAMSDVAGIADALFEVRAQLQRSVS